MNFKDLIRGLEAKKKWNELDQNTKETIKKKCTETDKPNCKRCIYNQYCWINDEIMLSFFE